MVVTADPYAPYPNQPGNQQDTTPFANDIQKAPVKTQNPGYEDPNWTWAPEAAAAPAPAPTSGGKAAKKGGKGRGGSAGPKTGGTTAAAPTAASTQASIDQRIKDQYPTFAWALEIPDLAAVLRKAIADPSYSSTRLQADLQNTTWWKTTPGTVRTWIQGKSEDPATYGQQRNDQIAAYKQLASQYLVPVSDSALGGWVDKQDADQFKKYLTDQAASLYPGMAAALKSGVTPTQFADPYKQVAAQTLEINPDTIDFQKPQWQKALTGVDPASGQRVSMSLSDWQTTLRSDPNYGYQRTAGAKSQAFDIINTLSQTFGKVA